MIETSKDHIHGFIQLPKTSLKFKIQKHDKVGKDKSQNVEHLQAYMQVPKGMRPGAQRRKRLLLQPSQMLNWYVGTSQNSVYYNVTFDNKVVN